LHANGTAITRSLLLYIIHVLLIALLLLCPGGFKIARN
jgi:hypothetical protein